jgi:hypothetical protein
VGKFAVRQLSMWLYQANRELKAFNCGRLHHSSNSQSLQRSLRHSSACRGDAGQIGNYPNEKSSEGPFIEASYKLHSNIDGSGNSPENQLFALS